VSNDTHNLFRGLFFPGNDFQSGDREGVSRVSLVANTMDYDEFGNYIGPELDSDGDDHSEDFDDDVEEQRHAYALTSTQKAMNDEEEDDNDRMDVEDENRIVLHEDKKYYPDADEVYPGVKTVTLDEDAQELNEPIIKPVKTKQFSVLLKETPKLKYEPEFLTALMQTPPLIRNVAVLGQLHHGKSLFLDSLVQAAQEEAWDVTRSHVRFSDTRVDEQERQLSIKTSLLSLVLPDLRDKSYLLNLLDCPGHTNFSDEATAALRAADSVLLVVDAVEGVMLNTERLLKQALLARLPVVLVRLSVSVSVSLCLSLSLSLSLSPSLSFFLSVCLSFSTVLLFCVLAYFLVYLLATLGDQQSRSTHFGTQTPTPRRVFQATAYPRRGKHPHRHTHCSR
jgi:hypothetical protein